MLKIKGNKFKYIFTFCSNCSLNFTASSKYYIGRKKVAFFLCSLNIFESLSQHRGVFKALSNIKDGAFYEIRLTVKSLNYFCKIFHFRYLAGL